MRTFELPEGLLESLPPEYRNYRSTLLLCILWEVDGGGDVAVKFFRNDPIHTSYVNFICIEDLSEFVSRYGMGLDVDQTAIPCLCDPDPTEDDETINLLSEIEILQPYLETFIDRRRELARQRN